MRARGEARRRETWARGLRGEEHRLRAHKPRSGGSCDDGGDQFRPSRRRDLSRPAPPWEIFQREGTAPEKISWRRVLSEKSFFRLDPLPENFFHQNIFSKPIYDGISPPTQRNINIFFSSYDVGKDRLFANHVFRGGKREHYFKKLNSREGKRQRYLVVQ